MSIFETSYEYQPGEWESGSAELLGESYEAESEEFLGGLLGSVLGGEMESPINETMEMELAAELLEITNEAELEEFLGKMFKTVARGVGNFAKSGVGKALGGVLKTVAKTALPMVGGALGSMVAPGIGTALGSKLGSMAGGLFELELEGLNEQEAEMEVARSYVRLASSATRNALRAPRNAPPRAVAKAAVVTAARRHAPGLLRGTPYQAPRGGRPPAGRRPGSGAGRSSARRGPRPVPYGGYAAGGYDTYTTPAPPLDAGDGYDTGWDVDASGERAYRTQSGRWIRRGRKIVILGV